jgi:Leucine-rich repeat (LRR) protein
MEYEDISILIRRCKRSKDSILDLSHRELTSLPNNLKNLVHLKKLDLSNNDL